jgi:hypothetical protein
MKTIAITATVFLLTATCAMAHHGRRGYWAQTVCNTAVAVQPAIAAQPGVAAQSTFADGAKIGPPTGSRAYQPYTSAYQSYETSGAPRRTSPARDYGPGWGWGNGWNGQGYRWHSGW